jgi:hypothetical protein
MSSREIEVSRKKYRYGFTATEDEALRRYVSRNEAIDWEGIARKIPGRSARQCRERWFTYLAPGVNRGPWTEEEDGLLFDLLASRGQKWGSIAGYFSNRTQNNIKNRWNTIIRRARALGYDPADRDQFIETGRKIISRTATAVQVESKPNKALSQLDPQTQFSLEYLLN